MDTLELHCAYEDKGIRILQGYGDLTRIRIPAFILDLPVREIGPYCFSASDPASRGKLTHTESFFCALSYDDDGVQFRQTRVDAPSLPPLMGRSLEEIFLPSSLSTLHNAAFYNCRQLSCLGFGPGLLAVGSDVFTNCSRLTRLLYDGNDREAGALALILNRLEGDITAAFTSPEAGKKESGENTPCRHKGPDFVLFFPEYYEWLDEVTPAHLFSRSIHGEGFRMRKCIKDGQVLFDRYDACYVNVLKTESLKTQCRIADIRLRWPLSLTPAARRLYEQTLCEHYEAALDLILSRRSTDSLHLLLHILTGSVTDQIRKRILEKCIRADWGEGAAIVMEIQGRMRPAKKTYTF